MRRAWPLAAALVLAFVSYSYQAVQLPGRVLACSCISPLPTLAEVARDEGTSIVVGTVGRALPDRTPITVEGSFVGGPHAEIIWLSGGTNSMSSCDIFMSAGERRLLVLYGGPSAPGANGLYSASSCAPGGVAGTPEGDALLAEAADSFGAPQAPPSPEPEPENVSPIATEPSPWPGQGFVWVAAAVGVAILLLGGIVLFARRRPTN